MAEVYRWASRRGHERALAILAEYGNPELHAVVRALMEDNNKTAASIRSTIARALKWAVIPQLAAAVDRQGTFNACEFALGGGTLHLIASGDSRSVITPLLRALASYVHFAAGLAGSRTAAGRLDPPLLMAMDEVAQVCPVDLPSMLADSAGKGIVFATVGHSLAKLEERYGEEGAANIWAISGVKMLLRGITEPQTLEDVSRVCGTLGDDDDKARIVPPDVLRRLPKHCALVINMDLSPAVVRVSRAWKRRSVRRLAGQIPAPARPAGDPGRGTARLARTRARRGPGIGERPRRPAWPAGEDRAVSRRSRPPQILPGPRCGWPDRECKAPDSAHGTGAGGRRPWTYHDVQCQAPNPSPGPHLDGYPECGLVDGHAGGHDYVRHAAEGFLAPAVAEAREPEIEAEL